jgi:Zn ribbon nucleic-acid-binding protein
MSFANEKTVETKQCTKCSSKFEITDKDLEFYDKVSPIFNDEKYSIPAPTLCPKCRQIRRLMWRKER